MLELLNIKYLCVIGITIAIALAIAYYFKLFPYNIFPNKYITLEGLTAKKNMKNDDDDDSSEDEIDGMNENINIVGDNIIKEIEKHTKN